MASTNSRPRAAGSKACAFSAAGSRSKAKEKAGKCRARAASPNVVTLECPSVPARRESATSRMNEFGSPRAICEQRSGAAAPRRRKARKGKTEVSSTLAPNLTR